ncbi:MAG: tetratricopeptide repeat protein, partial [Nitrospirota bacterium]
MFLPKGEYLKPAALGYDQLVADIVWLQAIQVIGDKRISEEGYNWIYHALDVVTTLNPKMDYAYQVGGIVLSAL